MSLENLTNLHPDIKVKHSEEFSFSKNPPVEFFDSDKKHIAETAFSNLYAYLTLPYVIDSFENHGKRREFKNGLEPKMLEAYGENALRTGKVNVVNFSLQFLHRLYADKKDAEFFDKIEKIKEYIRVNFDQDYDGLSSSVKIDRTFDLKNKVVSLLYYLEVKKDTSC